MIEERRRPDPDKLLKALQEGMNDKKKQGKLKLFLGYSAGVGKTYRMLQSAQGLSAGEKGIVIGIVETHGRKETEALTNGLETIPRKKIEYQDFTVSEMDIDAILRRKPAIALVDELAHTNAAGSRNAKRFQDIEELLSAGIDVYSTLNIQHLESVNDIIEGMTGIKVREIVPDGFMEKVDEIELVDIPIEELEKRMKEGKVYIPEKARTALLEFFKKSNLIGLRELALRYTAKQIGEDMVAFMRENMIHSPLPVGSRILVSISPSPSSQKLIRMGHRLADDLNAGWFAVYVETMQSKKLGDSGRNQLNRNIKLAEELGAEVVSLVGDRVADEITDYARENHISLILTGFSSRSRLSNLIQGSIVNELIAKARPIQVMLVETSDEIPQTASIPEKKKKEFNRKEVLHTLYTLTGTGFYIFLCYFFFKFLGFINTSMLLLLPVLFIGIRWGRTQGILASVLSTACLDFLFVKPYFSFSVLDIQYLPAFFVFLAVGVTASLLSERLKWRIDTYRAQEKFLSSIYRFSRTLMTKTAFPDILEHISGFIGDYFQCGTALLLPDKSGSLRLSSIREGKNGFGENETGISAWVFKNGKPAGKGTDTLSSSPWYFLPLSSSSSVIGVIALNPDKQSLTETDARYLDSFAGIAALAISKMTSMSSSLDYILKNL